MPKRRYTDDERAAALALYAEAGPTAVQDTLGIPKGTVTGWAKTAGIGTVRNERTAAATEAMALDAAERRAVLADRLLAIAEQAVDVEVSKLRNADLRDVVGARTRAIHDHLLLAGEATSRSEHVQVDAVDAEIARLTSELAGNDPAPEAAPVGPA